MILIALHSSEAHTQRYSVTSILIIIMSLTCWNNHFVPKLSYQFMIPKIEQTLMQLRLIEFEKTILSGVIHLNGFGHLVNVTGREAGSMFLSGSDLMVLWDRICTNLHTREVSMLDISIKSGMHLRLLETIAFGHPWFGWWGYSFAKGRYGVTETEYVMATKILKQVELRDLVSIDFLNLINTRYKTLQSPISNLAGLLKVMLSLLSPRLHSRNSPGAILALPNRPGGVLLVSDMNRLYRIMMETRILSPIIETVLRGNILAKRWHDIEGTDHQGSLLCRIRPISDELERRLTRGYPPGELLILSRKSTVTEFKNVAQQVMRDTYFVMENVSIHDIEIEGERGGAEVLFDKVEPGSQVSLTAANINFDTELMYQGGNDIVKCKCGASENDLERMVVCCICNVYQHMFCLNIFQPVSYYVCDSCRAHEDYFGENPWGGSYQLGESEHNEDIFSL